MSSAVQAAAPERMDAPTSASRETIRRALLACGVLAAVEYIVWHEVAALQWDGYSRISNAISELSLTGNPSRAILVPWQLPIYDLLLIGFGVGIWVSARGKRSLRAAGALQIVAGATLPLWLLLGESSVAVHVILAMVSVLSWFGTMGFAAVGIGGRFRLYTIASAVAVLASFVPAFMYAPAVEAGDPTPYIGLFERIGFAVYFVWTTVFAIVLWRRQSSEAGEARDTGLRRSDYVGSGPSSANS